MYAHNVGEPRSQSIGIEQNAYTFGRQIQITKFKIHYYVYKTQLSEAVCIQSVVTLIFFIYCRAFHYAHCFKAALQKKILP